MAPRIFFILSAWLCIINRMSKMASPMCSNFSHLFLMVYVVWQSKMHCTLDSWPYIQEGIKSTKATEFSQGFPVLIYIPWSSQAWHGKITASNWWIQCISWQIDCCWRKRPTNYIISTTSLLKHKVAQNIDFRLNPTPTLYGLNQPI